MSRSVRTFFAYLIAAVALAILAPSRAFADEGAAARVEDLKKRGNQAMMDLNYADALDAYTAALGLAPDDAALYYNLGRAHQAREDYPEALDALEQFVQRASVDVRSRVPKLDQLMADVRSRVAVVLVQCSAVVADAVIAIGEKATLRGCTTTAKQVRIGVPGHRATVDVRLTAATYQAQTKRINLEGGAPSVAVTLTVLPKATSGTLVVRVSPADALAVISVDGVERGNSPLEVPIAAGPHTVDVRAPRHEPAHVPVIVVAGVPRDVPVTLQRSAPITSKWWFWTGVGVVVVGVGMTIWYLATQPESGASKGSIDPGQVSAPLVRF